LAHAAIPLDTVGGARYCGDIEMKHRGKRFDDSGIEAARRVRLTGKAENRALEDRALPGKINDRGASCQR